MRIGLKKTMFSEGSGADGGTHDYIDGLAAEKPG